MDEHTHTHTHTELTLPTVPVVWFTTALCEDVDRTIVQVLWMLKQMDCGRAGLVQDDIRARMKEDVSLMDLRAPMTSTVASMVASMGASLVAPMASMVVSLASMASMASMVAPMAPLVASMASLASMVEALDWLQWMTAESKCDDERVDGWIHKIREEHTDGLPFVDDVVQVVTWVRTKRVDSLVGPTALMTRIASTVALMVALVASSRSKETTTARSDREGIETRSIWSRSGRMQRWGELSRTCRASRQETKIPNLFSQNTSETSTP